MSVAYRAVILQRWSIPRRPVVIRLRLRAEVIEIGLPYARDLYRSTRSALTISGAAALIGAAIPILLIR